MPGNCEFLRVRVRQGLANRHLVSLDVRDAVMSQYTRVNEVSLPAGMEDHEIFQVAWDGWYANFRIMYTMAGIQLVG